MLYWGSKTKNMTWIGIALGGYFSIALAQVLDKFLISGGRIPKPAVYTLYVTLFSLFSLLFAPFGLQWLPLPILGIFLVSGLLFAYSLLAFYSAIRHHDVVRIVPIYGLVTSLTVALFTFLFPGQFGVTAFDTQVVLALFFLIAGGVLIAYDLPLQKSEGLPKTALLAGLLLGGSLLLLKVGYGLSDFINGLVWSRIGAFLGGLSILLFPVWRAQVREHQKNSRMGKRTFQTLLLFIISKTSAGTGSFLILYATALGSVAFVQALAGFQYLFLLFMVIPSARLFPGVFHCKLSFGDWFQKFVALVLIGLGFYFLSFGGILINAH